MAIIKANQSVAWPFFRLNFCVHFSADEECEIIFINLFAVLL